MLNSIFENIIKLRVKQAQRQLQSLGLFYGFVVLAVLAMLQYSVFFHTKNEENIGYIIIFLIVIYTIHWARNDHRFLAIIWPDHCLHIYLFEYTALSLILGWPILLFDYQKFIIILFVILLVSILSNLSFLSIKSKKPLPIYVLFPKQAFEWRVGLRKIGLFVAIIWLAMFGLGFYFGGGFVLIGFITSALSSIYLESEPLNYITSSYNNANYFLKSKLLQHIKFFFILTFPLVIFYLLLQPHYWKYYILIYLMNILNLVVYLLNKYKCYLPNSKQNSNNILSGILLLGMFLPYLFPISLILIFIFYKKAVLRMKFYLDVDNQ